MTKLQVLCRYIININSLAFLKIKDYITNQLCIKLVRVIDRCSAVIITRSQVFLFLRLSCVAILTRKRDLEMGGKFVNDYIVVNTTVNLRAFTFAF